MRLPVSSSRRRAAGAIVMAGIGGWLSVASVDGAGPSLEITVPSSGAGVGFRIEGAMPGTPWLLRESVDLHRWETVFASGRPVVLAAGSPVVEVAPPGSSAPRSRFFRAVPEGSVPPPGLYDVRMLRDVHLSFVQEDWAAQLTANYPSRADLPATLTVDGVSIAGVGVHYKGVTSYIRALGTRKKPFNISVDAADPSARLLGFRTLNLNNAIDDPSLMQEVLFSNVAGGWVPSPRANFMRLFVNGDYFGLYDNVQQGNVDLLREWFPDPDGDRWGAGIGADHIEQSQGILDFGGSLRWRGPDPVDYPGYELKTDNRPAAEAWAALIDAIDFLNHASDETFAAEVDTRFAVDRWLWLLALENAFLEEDGYLYKGGDYQIYRDDRTGRFHPMQHDGNEIFRASGFGGRRLESDPLYGADLPGRPLARRLLAIPRWRERYLAHLRTLLEEALAPAVLGPRIDAWSDLIRAHVLADTGKRTTDEAFEIAVGDGEGSLKQKIRDRRAFLATHPRLDVPQPRIAGVAAGDETDVSLPPAAGRPVRIEADVDESEVAVAAVTVHWTAVPGGPFESVDMHRRGVGAPWTAILPAQPAGTTVAWFVEARADDAAGTLACAPVAAESGPERFRLDPPVAASTPVVINELMASNGATLADPQGEFDDWIELRNLTGGVLDAGGLFLSDDVDQPRKWRIPDGTVIPAGGFLLVWADGDTGDAPGLHASFQISRSGETLLLVDSDARGNALLDVVSFGPQERDRSAGRLPGQPDSLVAMDPTPGAPNAGG